MTIITIPLVPIAYPSVSRTVGVVFLRATLNQQRATKALVLERPRKSDPLVVPDRSKPKKSDPFVVPDGPVNLPNSATSAATHANTLPNLTHVINVQNASDAHSTFNSNTPQQPHAVVNLANDSFSAKRRRLLSTPLASALVTTNLLQHITGGTIRASSPDVGSPAASLGLGSPDEMDWLTRMFHPPN